jgi:hypothetical protein
MASTLLSETSSTRNLYGTAVDPLNRTACDTTARRLQRGDLRWCRPTPPLVGTPVLSLLLGCSLLQCHTTARLVPPLTTNHRSDFSGEEWIRSRVWTSGMSFDLVQLVVDRPIGVDDCDLMGWWVFDGPIVEGWKWAGMILACPSHCYGPSLFLLWFLAELCHGPSQVFGVEKFLEFSCYGCMCELGRIFYGLSFMRWYFFWILANYGDGPQAKSCSLGQYMCMIFCGPELEILSGTYLIMLYIYIYILWL